MTKGNVTIIAEAAQGFEGNALKASLLIAAAAAAKANAVKFQMVLADELATPDYKHYELFKSLELPETEWHNLKKEADDLHIEIIIDVFGPLSLSRSLAMGVSTVMTHATDLANQELLREIASSPVDTVILGIGGAYRHEIDTALAILREKNIVLMFGFQGYPTEVADNNISRIQLLCDHVKDFDHVKIGFADHSLPETSNHLLLSLMAIGAGALVLEKHMTLGECIKMEDYESALNPDRFKNYVEQIHQSFPALGLSENYDDFGMATSEVKYRQNTRRSVISARALKKGQQITAKDLTQLRHSENGDFTAFDDLIGCIVNRDIPQHTAIKGSDIDQ